MSFSRHNIEKRQLIELVRKNPILWDCRLPHYKRSDKKKAVKWNELGSAFNVSGERVQRTFTSLREIFRRELNQEKQLGESFISKFEFYKDMEFLKAVIRERKSRDRLSRHNQSHHIKVKNVSMEEHTVMDEYQFFAPNDPNNPNNVPQNNLQKQIAQKETMAHDLVLTPANEAQQNVLLSKQNVKLNAPTQDKHNNGISLSEIRSRSTSPSIYIKSEIDSEDESDADFDGIENIDHLNRQDTNKFVPISKLSTGFEDISGKKQTPTMINIDTNQNAINATNDTIDIDVDETDAPQYDCGDALLIDSSSSTPVLAQTQTTAREILHKSFGDFLTARLNTLSETVADDLINRILMLITEKATV